MDGSEGVGKIVDAKERKPSEEPLPTKRHNDMGVPEK